MITAINLDEIDLEDVLEENTERLIEREAEENKWAGKKNHIWKYASRTPQGDAGESTVCTSLHVILSAVYGEGVECYVINKGKGEFDVLVTLPDGRDYKIEVKTATEDVNGYHQFNGLRKKVDYDFAFLFGVGPEDFFYEIASHEYLCEVMTTKMSKGSSDSYKHTISQKKLNKFTKQNLFETLCAVGIIK